MPSFLAVATFVISIEETGNKKRVYLIDHSEDFQDLEWPGRRAEKFVFSELFHEGATSQFFLFFLKSSTSLESPEHLD